MKNIIILLYWLTIISILACISCKKNSNNSAKSPIGTWCWIDTYYVYPLSDSNPKTPANTGNTELLVFNNNNTFKRIMNNVAYDSGTFTYGHGSYIDLFNNKYVYDSILYYHYGSSAYCGRDYYGFQSDTLRIGAGYAGQFGGCYNMPYNGTKSWIKQ